MITLKLDSEDKRLMREALDIGKFTRLEKLFLIWNYDLYETPEDFFEGVAKLFPAECRREKLLEMKGQWQAELDCEHIAATYDKASEDAARTFVKKLMKKG